MKKLLVMILALALALGLSVGIGFANDLTHIVGGFNNSGQSYFHQQININGVVVDETITNDGWIDMEFSKMTREGVEAVEVKDISAWGETCFEQTTDINGTLAVQNISNIGYMDLEKLVMVENDITYRIPTMPLGYTVTEVKDLYAEGSTCVSQDIVNVYGDFLEESIENDGYLYMDKCVIVNEFGDVIEQKSLYAEGSTCIVKDAMALGTFELHLATEWFSDDIYLDGLYYLDPPFTVQEPSGWVALEERVAFDFFWPACTEVPCPEIPDIPEPPCDPCDPCEPIPPCEDD